MPDLPLFEPLARRAGDHFLRGGPALFESRRNRKLGCAHAREGRFVVVAVLMSALLSACGGGGGGDGGGAGGGGSPPSAVQTSSGESGLTGVATGAKGATTLSWMPPTMYDDGTPLKVTGYRIYWGLTEGHYPNSVTLDNPGLTRYVVEQLKPATWYFVATALSSDGESPPSNVVAMNVL
jgi:hypothetical protein